VRAGFIVLALAALGWSVACETAQAQTVRVPFPRDPGTLTPLTFTLGYPLLALVYDTVTWRDAGGVPRPWLARSVRALDGGRRVVVRLRDGLRWHDGRPLTAGDVAFTYDFMRARRHPRFAPQLEALASVRAPDRRTVEFRLRHPSIGFADQPLADVPILPAHIWSGIGSGLRAPAGAPVGSGPYRVTERRRDGALRLEAVRDYFRGRPRADRIDVPIVREASEMLTALRNGSVDTLPFTLTREQAARVSSISVRIARGPLYLGTMLMFNARRPPFDRPQVRRAISAALDRARIARAAGNGRPATTGFLHPESRWAPAPAAIPPPPAAPPLAALGLPPIRVLAPANDPVRRETARQVVLGLRRAGARARLRVLSRARLGQAVGEGGDARRAFAMAVWSIPALVSFDPDYLAALFGARGGGVLNRSGYRSAAFDRLAARVASAPTPGARRRAVSSLLGRLERDAPAVPLLFSEGAFAYRSPSPVDWAFVAGSGILDKQSLLRSAPDRADRGAAPQPASGDGGDGLGLLRVLGVGILAAAVLLGGAAAVGRRA
jgi:peptide/nickel transport system substrate-binding protein